MQALSHQAVLSSRGFALRGCALPAEKPPARACCRMRAPSDGDAAACTVQAPLSPCFCRVRTHEEAVIVIMTGRNFFFHFSFSCDSSCPSPTEMHLCNSIRILLVRAECRLSTAFWVLIYKAELGSQLLKLT